MEPTRERLVQSLELKLGDLEHKVQAYRHELVVEFQRYYDQTLNDATPAIADEVERSIQASLSDRYPALSPELKLAGFRPAHAHQADSPGRSSLSGRPSPPPAVFGPPVAADNSHDREHEFPGLFTPFFLPLLESSPPVPSSLPAIQSLPMPMVEGSGMGNDAGAPSSADQQKGIQDMEGPSETGGHAQGTSQAQAQAPSESSAQAASQSAARRPSNGRRATDDTPLSPGSDKSETKTPRSALRRSSILSKQSQPSPRRVRFEFQGAEVLPTASPQTGDPFLPRQTAPGASDNTRSFDEILGDGIREDDSSFNIGLPPRKISSSDALRALSRAPLDEGTVWTVVNPTASDENTSNSSSPLSAAPTTTAPVPSVTAEATMATANSAAAKATALPTTTKAPETNHSITTTNRLEGINQGAESEDSSDEEFLSMGQSRSSISERPKETNVKEAPKENGERLELISPLPTNEPSSTTKAVEDKDLYSPDEFESDEMFHFETGGLSAPPRPRQPRPPKPESPEQSPPPSPRNRYNDISEPSPYSKSPAVAISRPSGPITPTSAKFAVGSLGSYKGRPVVMPIVKDPDLHAQVASLGNFNTFVGGLDGRTGVDEGDLNSFRASLAQGDFSGTPRSLTERMMMEEARGDRNTRV
ncbi:unnamed protein product [Clonostachys chloroleuca]|uniref:Uncharacterized protein n=1 Tax=Clonostachys chloroleuca TaxID=1926264 RepID=A0AA35LSX7_9HYPO|nr:unnamed protein product [Clonostachys chloroleuca]